MTTISASSTIGILLSAPSYANPVVVDPGVTITNADNGIYATAGSWTIQNAGSIAGTGTSGRGIQLDAGGSVTNTGMGTISGAGANGVYVTGAAGTVINAGIIMALGGTHSAVALLQGGYVSNAGTGTISGAISGGIYVTGAAGIVVNAGRIAAGGTHSGVSMEDGGSVTNQSGGTITGGTTHDAVFITGAAGTVTNYGLLAGVNLNAGGTVTNQGGGTINNTGGIGVELFAGGVLINNAAATIEANSVGVYGATSDVAGTVINAGDIAGGVGGDSGGGIVLRSGGSITNSASASITGGNYGIVVTGGAGTVLNSGSIATRGTSGLGVQMTSGGLVTNAASASITASRFGVLITSGAGTVLNAGSIAGGNGTSGLGVDLEFGGLVTNAASASITGGRGVRVLTFAGTVVNDGSIAGTATSDYGVFLQDGGSVTNAASASITGGGFGIDLIGTVFSGGSLVPGAAGTVINAGTIIGNNGTAVAFGSTGSNRLVLDPGFGFSGVAIGSTSASNTLELASAASAGALSGLGSQYVNFTQTTIDIGATWTLTGANTVSAGQTMTNSGSLKLLGATLTIDGSLENDGTISADPSSLIAAGIGGVGTIEIGANSTLIARGTVSAGETIAFTGTNGVLDILHAGDFAGTITGQGPTDQVSVACFASGTRILTAVGEVPVEDLRIGDRVVTLHGCRLAPIVWLGHRQVDCVGHPRVHDVWPIRIKAGAIADGVPHRDLWLSAEHAMLLRDERGAVLVPVRHLLNGTTIAQVPCASITYWHVETASHDAIVAEGLPAETYLDTGNRSDFANGGPAVAVHPTFADAVWRASACAPQLRHGDALVELHRRLAVRAAGCDGAQLARNQTG